MITFNCSNVDLVYRIASSIDNRQLPPVMLAQRVYRPEYVHIKTSLYTHTTNIPVLLNNALLMLAHK